MVTTTTGLATSFITFSRPGATGGGATTTLSNGKIGWAGHNLLTNSESFDASAWSKLNTTVSANQSIAPNGATTGDKLLETAATGFHTLNASATVISGVPYTVSVFCKAAERSLVQVAYLNSNFTAGASADVNLNDGTYTSAAVGSGTLISASVVNIGSGWYLISVTGSQSADTIGRLNISIGTGTGTYSYAGDVTKGILLWGAHLYRSDLGGMQLNPAMPAGMQSYYPTTPRNLLGYSEAYSDAAWIKNDVLAFGSGSIANAIAAPNGLQTADLITENSATATHSVYQSLNLPTGGSSYTASAYFRAGTRTSALIRIGGPGYTTNANPLVRFTLTGSGTATTLSTGSAVTGSSITPLADGWYRCSVTFTTGTNTLHAVNIGPSDGGSSATYAGNGTGSIYAWGAQLSDSASLDTYVPSYGAAVTSAAYYAPRLDFDPVTLAAKGLLVEEARTNLLLHTSDFSQTAWVKGTGGTISADAVVSPDGTTNADAYTWGTSTGSFAFLTQEVSSNSSLAHTYSIWLKRPAGSGSRNIRFSISDTTVSTDYSGNITVTEEWQRFSYTRTAATNTGKVGVGFWTGTSSSIAAGEVLHVYGAQLEVGSFATSYIPNGSAVAGATRAADVASVSTQAFPYSASESTIVAAFTNFDTDGSCIIAHLDGSAAGNGLLIFQLSGGTTMSAYVAASNVSLGASTLGATQKIGLAYNGTDNSAVRNGGSVSSVGTTYTETVDRLLLGTNYAGNASFLNGHIRQITYLPRRISNAELVTRTQ